MATGKDNRSSKIQGIVQVTGRSELLSLGVVSGIPIDSERVPLSLWRKWAETYSKVNPEIMFDQGDREYAFYRNIRDEPDILFDDILTIFGDIIKQYFFIDDLNEIRLDDAFVVSYDTTMHDTRGPKHMDPSDITINVCVLKSQDCRGSQVLFHGRKQLKGIDPHEPSSQDFPFLVNQEPGHATLHWGSHPHETTKLEQGSRTNVILTYCYKDKSRSDVALRSCYNV